LLYLSSQLATLELMWFWNLYKNRLNRENYLCGLTVGILYIILFASLGTTISSFNIILRAPIVAFWLISLYFFAFSLYIRRFHDFGRSGWWSLLLIIPLVGFITALVLLFIHGDETENKYGKQMPNELIFPAIFGVYKKEPLTPPPNQNAESENIQQPVNNNDAPKQ